MSKYRKPQKILYNGQVMQLQDIQKLAKLAQVDISEDEQESLIADMNSIIGYISKISEVQIDQAENEPGEIYNVAREDVVTTVTGSYTKSMLASAPDNQDGFIKVTKIL